MNTTRLWYPAALAVVATLTACGDDDDDGTADEATVDPVEVTMTDHAYDVSGPLRPGGTLRVRNDGDETHMMAMGRLHDGVALDDLLEAFQSDDEGAADALVDVIGAPGNYLTPGHELEITAPDLEPGTYVMVCFFGTEGDGTPHVFNGMAATLTVEGQRVTTQAADTNYTISPGKAIDGPDRLDPGHHVLDINATGSAKQLEVSLWRVDNDQTLANVRDRMNQLADAEIPPPGAGREAAQLLTVAVHPFGDSGRLLLGVSLDPGQYILAAINTDDDGEPEGGTAEQIHITVS
jgi:hypothetical protein